MRGLSINTTSRIQYGVTGGQGLRTADWCGASGRRELHVCLGLEAIRSRLGSNPLSPTVLGDAGGLNMLSRVISDMCGFGCICGC